jgi:predicted lysophospholipase L1 biosynthesis ABC-type transport system permease subunit
VPVTRVRSLTEVVAASVSAPRSLAILLLSFGALAVLIGGVGVYSLIAYVVSWRRREIGIRLALGAMRWRIVSAVVKESLMLGVAGSACGLMTAAAIDEVFARVFVWNQRARSSYVLLCARGDGRDCVGGGLDSGAARCRGGSYGNTEKRIVKL